VGEEERLLAERSSPTDLETIFASAPEHPQRATRTVKMMVVMSIREVLRRLYRQRAGRA
jgi:hypothetical protein